MPYKCQKKGVLMNETQRRNTKLTTEQKAEIKKKYETGSYSQRQLASEYGVSRRTIQFIIDPQKLEENKKRREERGGSSIYYNREKHTEAMRKHRRYKQELYTNGEISTKDTE